MGMARGLSVVSWHSAVASDLSHIHLPEISLFHPSSTIKVVIYRTSRTHITKLKHIVGQHTSEAIDLLENGWCVSCIHSR